MDPLDATSSVPRWVGPTALTVLGATLAATHGYHLWSESAASAASFFGSGFPMLLALAVAGGGPLLYRSRLDTAALTTTVVWGYIGGFVLGCISLLIAAHQALKGTPLHGSAYMVATTATGGALVGTVTGRFDALNRQKADLISSLQEATTALSTATTTDEVSHRAVEIANDVLQIPLTGIWLYDERADALAPAAVTEPALEAFDEPPTYRPGEGLSWDAFESGRVERYDDLSTEDSRHNPETVIRSEIIVPLGETGVMNFGSTEPSRFDDLDETVAELLGTATEAALVRADREEMLRTQRRLLRRQNERLEEFTSVVSHDLRNPLSVARGRTELAREDHTDAETHLDAATAALDDMESLIQDLLALAKQGQTVGETERVSAEAIAGDAWRNLGTIGATFEIEEFELDADPDRLRQLLENLFGNAAVHADDEPAVRLGPLPDGAGFFVEDDGPGIDLDARDRIFDIGYTDHEDGTGFGLSIVRRIADAHGWSVRATESGSGGARFEFRFDGTGAESST
jgi:signal transduction histidine kinase